MSGLSKRQPWRRRQSELKEKTTRDALLPQPISAPKERWGQSYLSSVAAIAP
jgi:hypothetical protein